MKLDHIYALIVLLAHSDGSSVPVLLLLLQRNQEQVFTYGSDMNTRTTTDVTLIPPVPEKLEKSGVLVRNINPIQARPIDSLSVQHVHHGNTSLIGEGPTYEYQS